MEEVFAHFAGIDSQQIQLLHSAESIIPIASNHTVEHEVHQAAAAAAAIVERQIKKGEQAGFVTAMLTTKGVTTKHTQPCN